MVLNPSAPFEIGDQAGVGAVRRAAHALASRMSFDETRAGRLALVVTELATNLAKHARKGEILLRPLTSPSEPRGVEVLAIDGGPGIPDLALSERDGHSTAGTLGHGLGAIRRQSDGFWVYTQPSGTVIAARVLREPAGPEALPLEIGAVNVSKPGEDICGDAWGWRMRAGRLAVIVADGLGHGLGAHEAARQAVDAFDQDAETAPQETIGRVHGALRPTRGAAVAALAVDLERGLAQYAGLGNIAAAVLRPDGTRQNFVSQNGIAGHTAPRLHQFQYPVPAGSVLVLHSDGLGTHWTLSPYNGLAASHPSLIAGVLYRDFARRRDDVTVVVASQRRSR